MSITDGSIGEYEGKSGLDMNHIKVAYQESANLIFISFACGGSDLTSQSLFRSAVRGSGRPGSTWVALGGGTLAEQDKAKTTKQHMYNKAMMKYD
jgi:hypothetical protein